MPVHCVQDGQRLGVVVNPLPQEEGVLLPARECWEPKEAVVHNLHINDMLRYSVL